MDTERKENTIISICIATYKRESLLKKLLESLIAQNLPKNIILEIVVVDNCSDGSAKKVFQNFVNTDKILFRYFVQPQKNISLTRNIGLINSTGSYLCFIDDDETASKGWVLNLYEAIIRYDVDGAIGNVEPVFEKTIPIAFRNKKFYFSTVGKTGDKAKFYYTTNAILKTQIIKEQNILFDPSYGLTGGEDVHFFERLARVGNKFIYCKEAITYEFVPLNRANFDYLFNRALRGGQSFLRRNLEFKNVLSFRITAIIKIIIRFFYGIALLSFYPISKKLAISGIISVGDSVGKIRAIFFRYKKIY